MQQLEVSLHPFDPARHSELLRTWLKRQHVRRWWGDPEQTFKASQEPSHAVHQAIIFTASTPVGYVRWQRMSRAELKAAGLLEVLEQTYDIDIFIGEIARLGRGIGPEALRILLRQLRRDPSIPCASVGTSVANTSAIRAYEKAGFRRLRLFDDPEWGRCWIMVAQLREDVAV